MISEQIPADWFSVLSHEIKKPYFVELSEKIDIAYLSKEVFPPKKDLFKALQLCPFESVKVVIIGQDPYHGFGQAHGLCFSVNAGQKLPPSLKNIFKELSTDLPGFIIPSSGNLEAWAHQGVLLLNSIMTVEAGFPGSHKQLGWEQFTNAIIRLISDKKENVVFLLWGIYAAAKSELVDQTRHLVLKAAHPSPLARGAFFGCRHFSLTNKFLADKGLKPVNWSLVSG